MSFSAIADAQNAIGRIALVFEAELLKDTKTINSSLDVAIHVENASFSWDAPPPEDAKVPGTGKKEGRLVRLGLKKTKKTPAAGPSDNSAGTSGAATPVEKEDNVFRLRDIDMSVPKGQLVAIVGPVGTGKTSLLEGLIGEMRRTAGTVAFGGSVGYCPQSAWIQNATIRDNICFGRPFDEGRYWDAVRASCLEQDLEMLPYGDMTEVGEKGISLSGGQKQRVNICRAVYCGADVQIYDDPLSALDAHVGKAVFNNVLLNAASGTTRLLVTHALHFLPQVDYIYTMVNGRIIERGTYSELMVRGGEFAKFVSEFGNQEVREEKEESAVEEVGEEKKEKKPKVGKALMQAEERATGSVSGGVYATYIRAGDGAVLMPLLLLSLVLIQGTTVLSSYW
jgi:ABC-type multidrug transport system fused ATPase/permease subunit